VQIAYAAVTLAGYVTYFASELLQLGKSGRITADNRQRKPATATAHQSAAEQANRDACEASDQGAESPSTHGMQLRNRKLHNAENACIDDDYVQRTDMPASGSAAASRLLEPRMLRLCGSFTLQVRPDVVFPIIWCI